MGFELIFLCCMFFSQKIEKMKALESKKIINNKVSLIYKDLQK